MRRESVQVRGVAPRELSHRRVERHTIRREDASHVLARNGPSQQKRQQIAPRCVVRWEDERYVRFYTRNTPEWLAMSWHARALFGLLMREVDRAGILKVGKLGLRGVAVAVTAPYVEIESPLKELLSDGCVRFDETAGLVMLPNYIEAQESSQSDAARKRASRERARALFGEKDDAVEAYKASRMALVASVYFVQSSFTGAWKIGWTDREVADRVREIERAHGHPVRLVHTHPGSQGDERQLFASLSEHRLEGEWFSDVPRVRMVTQCDCSTSHGVTNGHTTSQDVTNGHSSSLCAVPPVPPVPPVPNQPDQRDPLNPPSETPSETRVRKKPARKTLVPKNFQPSQETIDLFRADGVDVLPCVGEFVDHWLSEGDFKADWEATFRKRIRQLIGWGRAPAYVKPAPYREITQGEAVIRHG